MTDSRKKEIHAQIEVLETAAALIAGFGEEGQQWHGDDLINEYCIKHQLKLANQLNDRANKLLVKYGLKKNTYKYY